MTADGSQQAAPDVGASSPRLADVVRSSLDRNVVGGELSDDDRTDVVAGVITGWREACTIRTVEQLDALPLLSVVREVFRPAAASGLDYGGVWERRTSGWEPLSGSVMPPGYTSPRLPARLLWHPEWSAS